MAVGSSFPWSGRWELNPRQPAWKAGTLPLSYARIISPLDRLPLRRTPARITRSRRPPAESSRVEQALLGGQARIRTLEADGNRFTVCPLWPLGYLPEQPTTNVQQKTLSSFIIADEKRRAGSSMYSTYSFLKKDKVLNWGQSLVQETPDSIDEVS